jgi:hypothetical protein
MNVDLLRVTIQVRQDHQPKYLSSDLLQSQEVSTFSKDNQRKQPIQQRLTTTTKRQSQPQNDDKQTRPRLHLQPLQHNTSIPTTKINNTDNTSTNQVYNKGNIILRSAVIDGGTTNHICRHNILTQLQQRGLAPPMIAIPEGTMSIAFGRDTNPEIVIGYINTRFGRVEIVNNMSADALISEIEFTKHGHIIIKDNNTLAIISNCDGVNKLQFWGVRNPQAQQGTNESLWNAEVAALFQVPKTLVGCGVPNPAATIHDILQGASRTATLPVVSSETLIHHPHCNNTSQTVIPITLSQGVEELVFQSALATGVANSAKPRWTASQDRQARSLLWAANGKAFSLAKTLEAHALHGQPEVDTKLLEFIGKLHDDPAYMMTHQLDAHPGGSGTTNVEIGEEARLDIEGLWCADKLVHTSLALIITDKKSKFTKVYALNSKCSAADALNLYRDLLAKEGWQLKTAKFDAASEVSDEYVATVNNHFVDESNLRQSLASSSSQRSLQGVEVMKAPKEQYEKTVEARWRSIRKDFARALLAQNNVPQKHYWFLAFKDTAEMSNGFLHDHPYHSPFQQIYNRQPDAQKMLTVPWGALVVFRTIDGNNSGLVRATQPAFSLGVIMGRPLEIDGVFYVLRPDTLKITDVSDIRPLEIDELRLTGDQWRSRLVQFDASGRIINIPTTNTPQPTLRNILQRNDDKRFQATSTSDISEQRRANLEEWSGRVRRGGTLSGKSARQESGRTLRSDDNNNKGPKPVRREELNSMVAEEEHNRNPYSEADKAMEITTFGEDDSDNDQAVAPPHTDNHKPPLPIRPFTTDHPEVKAQTPIAKWFLADDTNERTLYEGKLKYYLPKAPTRPRPLFRIEYEDGDSEDINATELKIQQQLAATVAKQRANRKNKGRNLPIQKSQPSAQPPSEYPVDEEDPPIYWHSPAKEANPVVPTNNSSSSISSQHSQITNQENWDPVIRAFVRTYEDKPTTPELVKLKHLTTQEVVTTGEIKAAFEPFETDADNQDSAAGITAFHEAFGFWPSAAEQRWADHVTSILERAPTASELQIAAQGPVDI